MFSETKFYYKEAANRPTEEDNVAANADGWTVTKSKYVRKKRRPEKPTTENGNRSNKKKPEKAEAAQENGEEHNEATKKDKKKRAKTEKKKKADVSSDNANVATDSLVDTLSRTFTSVDPRLIEELIIEMGLTSFDPDNAPLRARILNTLIEKQQRLVIAPTESESDHDESDEKAHVEPEQVTSSGPTEEEKLQTEEEAQADEAVEEEEEAKESGTKKAKKKRRPKKKSAETGDELKEQEKKKQAAQKGKQKKQGKTGFDEEQESDEKQERTKKDELLNELNNFDPSSQSSINQLMKWKNEMETNWNEFASMFDELKGLELLIDKWIYTPDFRNIVCERPFVDFLSWFLPGDREYHEFVMAQIMEICRCLDTLGSDKKKAMQDVMSNHCRQLLQVLTIRGYANPSTVASIAAANSSTSKLHHLLLPRPSSLFPTPSVKDPLSNKIRELDSFCDGLSSGYEALQQQHNRVEQMKPTSNDSFRKVYAMLKNDVNSRTNSLVNERRKVQNELQMIEHERKSIETSMGRSVSPMQTELNKISVDLRTLSAQQKEYEKKLNEINLLLEQLQVKHKQLNDRIHEVKAQYGPKEEKLHYEHQNCSFQSVALEKEHKCYERISELADESWRKLEEWSQTFMEKYHGESEVCENQFIDQCATYIYSLLDAKTFLLNRVEHLKQMVSDARQYQARTKQLYGDTLILKTLNFNADGEPHIAFDMQVLEWIEKQLKQVVVKCRETVRKSSYQRFVLQLSAQLSNNGYDTTFLKPFVDEVSKETMYGASNPSGFVPTSLPTATGTMSSGSSANIGHVHPHVNVMHTGGNSSINTSSTHSPASARVHSYGVPIPATATNPTLATSNMIFPSAAVGPNNNVNVNANNPSLKPNVPTNFNVNPNANLNPNSTANVVLNRKPPVIVPSNQIDSSSHQPQSTQIPVFSKKTGPVMPKMPTVAKQTQTIPVISTSTAPAPQNDATAAQRLKNSQRRPPMISESSHQ